MQWSNWSGRQTAEPGHVFQPSDEAGLAEAVQVARASGSPLRAVGASHSHSRVAATDGVLVETDGWQGVLATRSAAQNGSGRASATIKSGTRIFQLGEPLYTEGLAVINQGDIDKQSIAGAISTGTHGTGPTLSNLSSSVVGLRLLLADGEKVACDATTEPELFEAARHSLGALGLITEVDLEVRDRYQLHERLWSDDPERVMSDIDRLVADTRHFEFFWMPELDRCACKALREVEAPAESPPGDAASPGEAEQLSKLERQGWSHQIISSIRDDLHTEMEYAIPAELGPQCFQEVRAMILRDFPELRWPVEYRTLAADDLWISAAGGRATVTISAHQDISLDDRPLFEACEAVFRRYQGRPHWGKVHYQTGGELDALYENYQRWWSVRDRFDPNGVFLTPELEQLRP